MRLTKDQAQENRQRILAEAGRLFRECGFDGIGVDELMRAAGFTRGGFYNHFACKDDLMAEVTTQVLETAATSLDRRMERAEGATRDAFAAYIAHYLSVPVRDDPGHSCPISALGVDVIRQDAPVRKAFAEGLKTYLTSLARAMPTGSGRQRKPATRNDAIALLASLVGAMVMARCVAGVDEEFSLEVLTAVRKHLLRAEG
jgi:TetR/AcrR family transcriptional repressor of nem operon